MKAPIFFGSLLMLAGTAATAESADAAISDGDVQEDLNQAICLKDWYGAIEVSSKLISSPTITPDYRQTLLDWRRQFYAHAQGKAANGEDHCAEAQAYKMEARSLNYQGPEPQFSPQRTATSIKEKGLLVSDPVTTLSNIWTVGVRVEGNSIRGTILNNGLTTARNVTLTIRSQKKDNSEDIKKVAIDAVQAWDEAEFAAAFNDTPGNWMIESIEVN